MHTAGLICITNPSVLQGVTSPQAQSLFSTGILDPAHWHGAQWISSTANGSLTVYRSEFTVTGRPIRARLYVNLYPFVNCDVVMYH